MDLAANLRRLVAWVGFSFSRVALGDNGISFVVRYGGIADSLKCVRALMPRSVDPVLVIPYTGSFVEVGREAPNPESFVKARSKASPSASKVLLAGGGIVTFPASERTNRSRCKRSKQPALL